MEQKDTLREECEKLIAEIEEIEAKGHAMTPQWFKVHNAIGDTLDAYNEAGATVHDILTLCMAV